MQDRFEPDAILQAAHAMPLEGWNEMLALCYPDKPFQFDRSLARALILVRPEVSVVAEDERAMVVHLPFVGQKGFLAIKNSVIQTPEGRIAEMLSDAYRFSLPSIGLFYRQIHNLDHIASKPEEYEWMTETARRFAWRAVRRFWEDMAEEGGGKKQRCIEKSLFWYMEGRLYHTRDIWQH